MAATQYIDCYDLKGCYGECEECTFDFATDENGIPLSVYKNEYKKIYKEMKNSPLIQTSCLFSPDTPSKCIREYKEGIEILKQS